MLLRCCTSRLPHPECESRAGSLATEDGSGSSRPGDAYSFQRLVTEVFSRDIGKLREYCADIDEWADAVNFLDEVDSGGWELLDALLQGESDCSDLRECPFLNVKR